MSRLLRPLPLLLAFSFGLAQTVGCADADDGIGDSVSDAEAQQLCVDSCEKLFECAGGDGSGCEEQCMQSSDGSTGGMDGTVDPQECMNSEEVFQAYQDCLAVDCSELQTCFDNVPMCE